MIDREYAEKVLARLPGIEARLADPETAANRAEYRRLVIEHARLSKLKACAGEYFTALDAAAESREIAANEEADPELRELAQEEHAELEAALPGLEKALTVALLPPDPKETSNAIVEIRAGTGGDEASLFAGDLLRMYSRYAEKRGWKIELVDASTNELGGTKEAVFAVKGEGAYGTLQYESGGHRVQRVPVTESQGRIHTSAATVAVFPEAEAEDRIEIGPDEVRIDIFRSSGPGGQSVNTTDSAVRITHLETGLVVQCQDEKSQHRNKEKAMAVLQARLLDLRRREEAEKMGDARRSLIGSGDRSQRIRTYNFPQNRLTDHRINLTLYSLDRVVEGEIDDLLAALREHDAELRLREELGENAERGTQGAEGRSSG
jgi:peptide chain release factor 1